MTSAETRILQRKSVIVLVSIFLLLTAVLVLLPFVISNSERFGEEPEVEIRPLNCYSETLRVVADRDYRPYSFVGKDGSGSGHDIELAAELANRLNMNLDMRLVAWSDALYAVRSGNADLVCGTEMVSGSDSREGIKMTIPILSDPFVVFAKKDISLISELYDGRIAVIENSGAEFILEAYRLQENCREYKSYTDAFLSVSAGESDFIVSRETVGKMMLRSIGIKGIEATEVVLIDNYLCIGVNEANDELRKRVNTALVGMIEDGTLERLESKWLGHYVTVNSLFDFFMQNNWLVLSYAAALTVLLISYVIYMLRRARTKERQLLRLAEADPLTGLLNRASVESQLRTLLDGDDDGIHALFIIDIDNFKGVNDNLGHMQGDIVLKSLADSLKSSFREYDIVGRLGGDEFFALMRNIPERSVVHDKARQLGTLFRNTYTRNDLSSRISASIGVAVYPEQGTSFDELYSHADAALYWSKEHGRNTYTIYEPSMQEGHNQATVMDR